MINIFLMKLKFLKLNFAYVEAGAKLNELNKSKEFLSRRLCFEPKKFAVKFQGNIFLNSSTITRPLRSKVRSCVNSSLAL